MDLLNPEVWVSITKIMLVDIVLAGDNAVVIGMAASKLAPKLQQKAILWGTAGAIILRLVLALLLVEALHLIPALHVIGGVVLLWIAIRLLSDSDEEKEIESKDSLREAIITIVMADAMMSIDNVLGVVGAAGGKFELVMLGMLISVPIIIFSSSLLARLINKYPIILYLGAGILGWVAGEMIVADDLVKPYTEGYEAEVQVICVILVLAISKFLLWRAKIHATRRQVIKEVTEIIHEHNDIKDK